MASAPSLGFQGAYAAADWFAEENAKLQAEIRQKFRTLAAGPIIADLQAVILDLYSHATRDPTRAKELTAGQHENVKLALAFGRTRVSPSARGEAAGAGGLLTGYACEAYDASEACEGCEDFEPREDEEDMREPSNDDYGALLSKFADEAKELFSPNSDECENEMETVTAAPTLPLLMPPLPFAPMPSEKKRSAKEATLPFAPMLSAKKRAMQPPALPALLDGDYSPTSPLEDDDEAWESGYAKCGYETLAAAMPLDNVYLYSPTSPLQGDDEASTVVAEDFAAPPPRKLPLPSRSPSVISDGTASASGDGPSLVQGQQ